MNQPQAQLQEAVLNNAERADPPPAAPPVAPLNLLHVEDNPADALLMQEYIRGILPDVQFDTADRMSELTIGRAAAAQCALLDLSLPDAIGLEALIALREMSEKLPIIVLTGFDDLEVGLAALRYGADDYLIKNHVDGFTLDRAVRYAIERRRLTLEVVSEAAVATIATADSLNADAALEDGLMFSRLSAGHPASGHHLDDTLPGTHQVAVHIDGATGEYSLSCESCEWKAERGDSDMHSWADRSLGWVLLRHVAFGDVPDPEESLPTPTTRAGRARAILKSADGDEGDVAEDGEPFQRRGLMSPQKWLAPHSAPGSTSAG